MVRRLSLDGGKLALALIVGILVYQVVIPLLMVVWTSLKVERPGETGFFELSFSLANYARAFGSGDFWQATWNTLYFALASTGAVIRSRNFSRLGGASHQHSFGPADRCHHPRANHHSRHLDHRLLDPLGEPEYRRSEPRVRGNHRH